MAEAKGYVSD
jgi:hypothetical protein